MTTRRRARGSVGRPDWVSIDPPLLPGEVEIDVSDLGVSDGADVDTMTTCRGDLQSAESRIRIEQMIAAARARRRERGDG